MNLLPHSGEMVLIDEVVSHGADEICVKSVIKSDNAFLENGKFPTYKALEMMAQSLGAYKGLYAKSNFKLGFLIASRKFEIFKPNLEPGDEILIKSKMSLQDENGFGVWDSEIYLKDFLVARASLSVLSPSLESFLEMRNG